jgi:putative membrane protein
MIYTIVKSIHIIGVICWFAGLFYLVRLYIYDKIEDENSRPESKVIQIQFRMMQKKTLVWNNSPFSMGYIFIWRIFNFNCTRPQTTLVSLKDLICFGIVLISFLLRILS